MKHGYWIEGKVSIPKEKREEFNENILKLFRLCGIRKLKEVEIAGRTIIVACEPEPDIEGMVRFDYSIFEGLKRRVSVYNMNTCELSITDLGHGEFGLVMNLAMTMQEAYSAKHCYFMRKNEVCDVHGYALLIEGTIGLKLSFPNREKMWDMFVFFKSSGNYDEMTRESIIDKFPYGYGHMNLEQLIACWMSSLHTARKPEDPFLGGKSELQQANSIQRTYYVYELLQKLCRERGREEVQDFLKNLLELGLTKREYLARQEDEFGSIAKASLYELPACIVAAYSWACCKEFWEVWYSLEITGYQDIYFEEGSKKEFQEKESRKEASEEKQEVRREPLFYKVILREDEDEFLEFWDGQELYLSDGMKRNLEEWRQEYENIEEPEAAVIDIESYLAEILLEMQDVWRCRYVDEKLVQEFLSHSNDLQFQKGLLLFRRMMDRNLEYFPELTARQVREWVTKYCCSEKERIRISGYASLLTNPVRRFHLLGF